PKCCNACEQVARIVLRGVADGKAIEAGRLGRFSPDSRRRVRVDPRTRPQVFIAYGKENEPLATLVYEDLNRAGFNPWMDVRKLLAGQNWPRAIESAIESSDFFVACFSSRSVRKKG